MFFKKDYKIRQILLNVYGKISQPVGKTWNITGSGRHDPILAKVINFILKDYKVIEMDKGYFSKFLKTWPL